VVQKIVHDYFPRTFDRLLDFKHQKVIRRIVVPVAIWSFIAHLVLIFCMNYFEFAAPLKFILNPNYSSAIYTPFSFILMYEIFEMVVVLPQSLTIFMAKQYEIASLIILREVFKDIAHFDSLAVNQANITVFKEIALDVAVSMILFLLVAVFLHVNKNRVKNYTDLDVRKFINVKKTISVILGHLLVTLAIYSLFKWLYAGFQAVSNHHHMHEALKLVFFEDFFSLMIFTDIFLLIFSLIYTRSYPILFRNSAFTISTILIKLFLTSPKPINLALAVMANLVGVFTVLIFIYYNRVLQRKPR
jgi:hypothetical protein